MMQCNSCNTLLSSEGDRNAHYRSEWHRYNLKRKVAGLPGVTEEWFKARCDAVAATSVGKPNNAVVTGHLVAAGAQPLATAGDSASESSSGALLCATCNKRYSSQSALDSHMRSKLHASKAAAASSSGGGAAVRKEKASSVSHDAARQMLKAAEAQAARGPQEDGRDERDAPGRADTRGEESDDEEEDGNWEEVADEEEIAELMAGGEGAEASSAHDAAERPTGSDTSLETAQKYDTSATTDASSAEPSDDKDAMDVEWDVRRCLFCEQMSADIAGCVEHMHRRHGFFLPDAEFLTDLPGLLQYLAARLVLGRLCLFCSERQFASVAAVRSHMEARSHAKLRYGDGSGDMEEELADFYDFSSSYEEEGLSGDLTVALASPLPPVALASAGMEIALRRPGSARPVLLGCREWARYYRQRPRPTGERHGGALAAVLARYRAMGLSTVQSQWRVEQRDRRGRDAAAAGQRRVEQMRTKVGIANDKIFNLPKNTVH